MQDFKFLNNHQLNIKNKLSVIGHIALIIYKKIEKCRQMKIGILDISNSSTNKTFLD